MKRRKMPAFLDGIVKHKGIIFPIIVVVLAAGTILGALKLSDAKKETVEQLVESPTAEELSSEVSLEPVSKDVPLVLNEDPVIYSLISGYYNALALGDMETIKALRLDLDDKQMIEISEKSKFVEAYTGIEVYSKEGYAPGDLVAYVYKKTLFKNMDAEYPGYETIYITIREDGTYGIKGADADFTQEEEDYIVEVSSQVDVIELNNRVTVEYNDLMENNPKLLQYLAEVTNQIEINVGVELGKLYADLEPEEPTEEPEPEEPQEQPEEIQPAEEIVLYVKTTATVNVRSSDSEKADKLGKAQNGTKLKVLEQKVNGWTKVLFENKEGYIKSEYLELQSNTATLTAIGTAQATTTVNVRSQASQTADKLGALSQGTQVPLFAQENGWVKIDFNGQVGYVKEDYVTVQLN